MAPSVEVTRRAPLKRLAQYAVAMLEGPRQIALLPYTASVHGRARADRVAAHVAGKPEADGMRWWGDLRGDIQGAFLAENDFVAQDVTHRFVGGT